VKIFDSAARAHGSGFVARRVAEICGVDCMHWQSKRAQEMTCACDQVSSQMKCRGCGYGNGEWAKAWVIAAAQMSVVVTACASSQPVRQKRPMRVTGVKT
jgi:hypothetical protein